MLHTVPTPPGAGQQCQHASLPIPWDTPCTYLRLLTVLVNGASVYSTAGHPREAQFLKNGRTGPGRAGMLRRVVSVHRGDVSRMVNTSYNI